MSTSGVTRGDPTLNSAFRRGDVRADRTPALHDGQDVFYHLPKFDDDGVISDTNTNSAVEGTSAVRTNEEASTTEDSAITARDPEVCSEQVLRDEQPVIEDRARFGVIRSGFVGEASSAMSTLNTRSADINHLVTASSALEDPDIGNKSEVVPAYHKTAHYASEEYGRVEVCPAVAVGSAVQRPSATTANSNPEVLLSRDVEANSEGMSWTMKFSNHGDEGDERAKCEVDGSSFADVVNSATSTPEACIIQSATVDSASAWSQRVCTYGTNSADQHSEATKDYNSCEVLLLEGIKPNDDPATADSALETMDADTGSDVVRRHDVDTTYLEDTSEHVEVRSAVVVDSVKDKYAVPEVLLLKGTGTNPGVTSSATTAFDPGAIGYSLEHAVDEETAWQKAGRVNRTDPKIATERVPAEVSWEDDECSSTGDPMETLTLRYLVIAATEDEQEGDVDDSKTDIFERSGTDLDLTDYAHELAFLPDFTEVEPTELDCDARNVKASNHTPAQLARLVAKLQKHEGIMISSGNVLPPPAYGALCDIDVQGHAPIKPKGRRIPLRHLSKLCELLKGLLRAGEFWAVLITRRARQISAFVCAQGHFEWLRMPFGLKNAPMIHQRLIDNGLWGCVQPKGGWKSFAERMAKAEAESEARRFELGRFGDSTPGQLTKFEADHQSQTDCDPVLDRVSGPDGDMFASGEPDQSNLVPVLKRRSFVNDICFGGETFDVCSETPTDY
ncbi:hypothetical protein PInf_010525 [Phytophthora infestans]|nr:hypothetical protein PInf_010525 [Phytophthora infestans]